ncbi:MAG: ParA family protein [Candidatus Wolfebacteria bacterium]|nr:ParA family protein [Candidatus Wolfebacteria bacterium]
MTRVISVCNQKGGVGKTATSVNVSAYLAALGKKVLLLDFDPQANASSGVGINPREIENSVYHGILGYANALDIIKTVPVLDFLHVLPANEHLAGALIEFVDLPNRERLLRRFSNNLRSQYDYIIIDLPPSLSLLTLNGLLAADEVIIPIQAEYYSLEGLGQLLGTIDLIRNNLEHDLKIAGGLITMYDKRERHSREVVRDVRRNFPYHIYDTEIPRSVALAEAPSYGKPVILYDPNSPGAKAYEKLTREIIDQEFDKVIPTTN